MQGINLSSMTYVVVQKGKSKWPPRRLSVARHDANADATSLWLDFTFSYLLRWRNLHHVLRSLELCHPEGAM